MDSESFKQRFFPLRQRMYRTAFCMTGNAADAEDVVQDVFLRLWERRATLESIENAEAYAVRLVRNRCVDMFNRADSRSVRAPDGFDRASDDDVGQMVAMRDRVAKVMEIIDSLPGEQGRVVTMRDIDDRPMEEIEQATGLTPVNVRVILSRARGRIRKYFSND